MLIWNVSPKLYVNNISKSNYLKPYQLPFKGIYFELFYKVKLLFPNVLSVSIQIFTCWICMVHIYYLEFSFSKNILRECQKGNWGSWFHVGTLTFSSFSFRSLCYGGASSCTTFSTSSVVRIRKKSYGRPGGKYFKRVAVVSQGCNQEAGHR